jgi:hypothetical protein
MFKLIQILDEKSNVLVEDGTSILAGNTLVFKGGNCEVKRSGIANSLQLLMSQYRFDLDLESMEMSLRGKLLPAGSTINFGNLVITLSNDWLHILGFEESSAPVKLW